MSHFNRIEEIRAMHRDKVTVIAACTGKGCSVKTGCFRFRMRAESRRIDGGEATTCTYFRPIYVGDTVRPLEQC
jgi:hypothetical protein